MNRSPKTVWDKFWKDKDGKWAVIGWPNAPLGVWLVSVPVGWVFSAGWVHNLAGVVGFGALFTWAYLEIRYGASYFRRLLGVIVLVATIINRV